MGQALSSQIKVIGNAVAATAAGTTDVNGAIIDTAGWEGVLFVVFFGALTATQVTRIKAQQDTDSGGSTMADIQGSLSSAMADGDSGKGLQLDIFRPNERYVRCVVDRGTANAVIDRGIAILYGPNTAPAALDATVIAQETWVSPGEGTA